MLLNQVTQSGSPFLSISDNIRENVVAHYCMCEGRFLMIFRF